MVVTTPRSCPPASLSASKNCNLLRVNIRLKARCLMIIHFSTFSGCLSKYMKNQSVITRIKRNSVFLVCLCGSPGFYRMELRKNSTRDSKGKVIRSCNPLELIRAPLHRFIVTVLLSTLTFESRVEIFLRAINKGKKKSRVSLNSIYSHTNTRNWFF